MHEIAQAWGDSPFGLGRSVWLLFLSVFTAGFVLCLAADLAMRIRIHRARSGSELKKFIRAAPALAWILPSMAGLAMISGVNLVRAPNPAHYTITTPWVLVLLVGLGFVMVTGGADSYELKKFYRNIAGGGMELNRVFVVMSNPWPLLRTVTRAGLVASCFFILLTRPGLLWSLVAIGGGLVVGAIAAIIIARWIVPNLDFGS